MILILSEESEMNINNIISLLFYYLLPKTHHLGDFHKVHENKLKA